MTTGELYNFKVDDEIVIVQDFVFLGPGRLKSEGS